MPDWLPAGQVQPFAAVFAGVPSTAETGRIGDDPLMRMALPVGRSGWAIASGYLGLFSVLLVPAPLAIITGILAIREIRRDPHKHGMGRAIFGIATGSLFTVILVLMLLASGS